MSAFNAVSRPIVPLNIIFNNVKMETYCLLDTGASRSVILEDFAKILDIKMTKTFARVVGFESVTTGTRFLASFSII